MQNHASISLETAFYVVTGKMYVKVFATISHSMNIKKYLTQSAHAILPHTLSLHNSFCHKSQ